MAQPIAAAVQLLLLLSISAVAAALPPPRLSRHPRFLGQFARANPNNTPPPYQYETKFFRQTLDHFSFTDLPEFDQRYLVGTAGHWSPGGPIFFYCGNEGDIEWFAANTGFVWEIAPSFSALVVFAEHRYYGESLPFGSKERAYKNPESLAYLTAEQALADFATLLVDLKRNLAAEDSPVILFGGSYGGMLAAWMRLKYPHIAIGALASSAPILQFEDIVPHETFYDIVSNDFRRESISCFETIKESWNVLENQGKESDGLFSLSQKFNLCQELNNTEQLSDWLDSAYSYLAMVDYPYPSGFLMPLPANPIKEVCRIIDSYPLGTNILDRIFAGVSIYYNYTGTVDCFDLEDDPHGMSGWNWQNIRTTLNKFGSNLIFSNGLLDPWSGGSVLQNISESVIALVTELGAHHIDLRASTTEDPKWLTEQRKTEINVMRGWIYDYYQHGSTAATLGVPSIGLLYAA